MPKLTAPLFSLSASKAFKKILTFQKRKSGTVVYGFSKPGAVNPFTPSASQNVQRAKIGDLVAQWQAMSQVLKDSWNELAKLVGYVGTGYHYFIHLGGIYPIGYEWSDSEVKWSDPSVSWNGF